jgi:hypothetical protein
MRYGLVWAMAPRHYSASLDEEVTRPLSIYVAELIRIRKNMQTFCLPDGLWTPSGQPYNAEKIRDFLFLNL